MSDYEKHERPYMPFYVWDFISSKKVRNMNYEQVNLYLRLLILQWEDGEIPSDPKKIAKDIGGPVKLVVKNWPVVRECFVEKDGRLINQRLDLERTKAIERIRRNRKNGQEGGKAKAAKSVASVKPEIGFGEGDYVPPDLSSIVNHYPETKGYPITRMAPTRQEVEDKINHIARRNEMILNGELDYEAAGDVDD